ncbi:uncharacterized protein isoform X3 [Rhodnius prolixus]|uniref:uncharacterized protein isoform X3 n=1 Tax=Rhodnius prolixus TaxID=13249 RepID=UPI003D189425
MSLTDHWSYLNTMWYQTYWIGQLVLATTLVLGDDNLRGALHAIQKRQRDISPTVYYSRPFLYSDGQPEDIGYGYQKSVSPNTAGMFDTVPMPYSDLGSHDVDDEQDRALEKLLLEYLEDSQPRGISRMGGGKRSVFRERDPESIQHFYEEESDDNRPVSPFRERDKARLQASHALVSSYGGLNSDRSRYGDENNDDDYLSVLNSIWEKYQGEDDPEDLSETDMEEILDYLSGKEEEKRQYGNFNTGYDFFNSPLGWKRGAQQHHHQKRFPDTLFDERYPYKGQKRYPITKRSPASYYGPALPLERRKKSEIKKTDPKVAAELNNIFDSATNKTEGTQAQKTVTTLSSPVVGQKEQTIEAQSSKPLQVKKKSINWSNYLGYDRKKKSADWLVDQYLRAYGMDQANSAYDKPKKKEDIDSKMRAMEDLIVDEAIKYTGAHEGTKDSKEIQEVKDKVMAQLAAAYSLEKMRRALGEFKASIAAQKATAPASHSLPFPKAIDDSQQQKRVAVKKEMAENAEESKSEKKDRIHHEADESNQVKQHSLSENSVSQPKLSEENMGECPVLEEIETRCKKLARSNSGAVGNLVFLPLCTLHQICYLCGPEIGATSPHTCDATFTNESQIVCRGNPACIYTSRLLLTTLKRFRLYDQECDWRHHPCLAQFLNSVTRR